MEQTFPISTEVSYLKRSVMRELLKLAVAPDMISLAGGLPASELLPVEEYKTCLNTVLERDGAKILQYSPQFMPLREWIANYMNARGIRCTAEQILITNGAQQGLNLISRLVLDSGDPAVIEAITFTGIQQVTAGRGAKVTTVKTDLRTGVNTDDLEKAFRKAPHLAILISDFHNPLGVSMSLEKRQKVAELAAKYRVPMIEDDPYSALRFKGEKLPPIKAFDTEDYIFYISSFSKMLAPAVRLGWVVAPENLIPQLTALRESFDLESSALTQRAVYEFLDRGYLEPHLQRLNASNHERCRIMLESLEEHFADLGNWTQPEGGLFVWVTLPENVNTWDMFQSAVDRKVAYIPGSAFAVEGGYQNTMRLNFSNVSPENIREGIARLAEVVKSNI